MRHVDLEAGVVLTLLVILENKISFFLATGDLRKSIVEESVHDNHGVFYRDSRTTGDDHLVTPLVDHTDTNLVGQSIKIGLLYHTVQMVLVDPCDTDINLVDRLIKIG